MPPCPIPNPCHLHLCPHCSSCVYREPTFTAIYSHVPASERAMEVETADSESAVLEDAQSSARWLSHPYCGWGD